MAITDGLLIRMQAAAGQSAPTNEVGAGETLTSDTGTATLVDVGAEKAWNLTGGQFTTTLTTGHTVQGSVDGSGSTMAVRMRVNTNVAGSFDPYCGVSPSTTTTQGHYVGRNGTGYRSRFYTTSTASSSTSLTSGVLTVVVRLTALNASNSDVNSLWEETVSRVGTDPDSVSSVTNWVTSTVLNNWNIDPLGSADFDVLDFIFWGRELSDPEAAAVADDIRGQLPLGGGVTTYPQTRGRLIGACSIGQGNGFGYKRF